MNEDDQPTAVENRMADVSIKLLTRPKEVSWFSNLSTQYANARDDAWRVYIVSYAFRRPDRVAREINRHSDGWHGTEGQFAQVLSRMISQL